MAHEYFLEAKTPLNRSHNEAVRNWLRSIKSACLHTNDNDTWFLFCNNSEKRRRMQWWLENPTQNDYLTSYIVIGPDGITMSLVESDIDWVAFQLAEWWLQEFGGRLLDSGVEITPQELFSPNP